MVFVAIQLFKLVAAAIIMGFPIVLAGRNPFVEVRFYLIFLAFFSYFLITKKLRV